MIDIDVDHQITAVQRTVGERTIDTGKAHVVTVSQSYDTAPATFGTRSPTSSAFPGGSCRFPAI